MKCESNRKFDEETAQNPPQQADQNSSPHLADLAFDRTDIELEIERVGSELRIRPASKSLAGVLHKFAKFSPDFMAADRGEQEQSEREGF